jgi:hypothetical protein
MLKQYILLVVTFIISFANSQWSTDPSEPKLIGEGIQPQVKSTSDGGVYIAWITEGDYHVYIQRLNLNGEIQFNELGMLISDNSNSSWIAINHLNLDVDSEDNAILTTVDQRTGVWEVYAWKISSEGELVWGEEGIAVTDYGLVNMSPRISILDDNSIIVSCTHDDSKVFIQRISSDGTMLFESGIFIEHETHALIAPQSITFSDNSFLIQWIGQAQGWPIYSEIFLQKFSSNGEGIWDEATTVMESTVLPMGNFSQQLIANLDGNSFSAWTQFSGNVQNAVVQLISSEGSLLWVNEIDLSTNSSHFRISPKVIVSEESPNLIAVWKETNGSQSQRGIVAQKLDESGIRMWNSEGINIVELNSEFDYLDLSPVGFGEEVVTVYIEQSANFNSDIFAKRIGTEGEFIWENEIAIITNSQNSKSDLMIGHNQNTIFISWSESGFIYAHSLRENGMLGNLDYEGCSEDEIELWSECYSIENTTELDLSGNDLSGEIPAEIGELVNLNYINLRFNELSGSIPNSICGLTDLTTLSLSYNQLSGPIPDQIGSLIHLENLYLQNNELNGEIPSSLGELENLNNLGLSENQLGGIIPENICVIFSNLDYLGIYSNNLCPPYPDCLSEESIGDQDTSSCEPLNNQEESEIFSYYLYDAYPNPFNLATNIKYKLKYDSQVKITIYDQKGRLINTLIDKKKKSGIKSIRWNGKNTKSQTVGSGMYFYRIQAGTFNQTKKLVLVK